MAHASHALSSISRVVLMILNAHFVISAGLRRRRSVKRKRLQHCVMLGSERPVNEERSNGKISLQEYRETRSESLEHAEFARASYI
jgi:hypothetical protein